MHAYPPDLASFVAKQWAAARGSCLSPKRSNICSPRVIRRAYFGMRSAW
jgi:hypothetical protein